MESSKLKRIMGIKNDKKNSQQPREGKTSVVDFDFWFYFLFSIFYIYLFIFIILKLIYFIKNKNSMIFFYKLFI